MGTQARYPTDLTEAQWQLLSPLLPKPNKRPGGPGRLPVDLRDVVNGILHVNKTGCQWCLVPKAYGPWNTVYHYFNDQAGPQKFFDSAWRNQKPVGRTPAVCSASRFDRPPK